MKRITYTSRSPEVKTKIVESKIADNHCGGVLKVNKAEFMEYLQLPAIPPTSNNYCSILNVSYTLKFIAKTSRLHSDLVIAFPFTIGTVPICDSVLESPQIRSERHKGKEQFSTKSAGGEESDSHYIPFLLFIFYFFGMIQPYLPSRRMPAANSLRVTTSSRVTRFILILFPN